MSDIPSAGIDAANEAIVVPGTDYYFDFCTGDTGTTGANESSEGRQKVTFGDSSGGTQSSDLAMSWSSAAGGTYPNWGLWTEATGGDFVRGGAWSQTWVIPAGAPIYVPSGAISCTGS